MALSVLWIVRGGCSVPCTYVDRGPRGSVGVLFLRGTRVWYSSVPCVRVLTSTADSLLEVGELLVVRIVLVFMRWRVMGSVAKTSGKTHVD